MTGQKKTNGLRKSVLYRKKTFMTFLFEFLSSETRNPSWNPPVSFQVLEYVNDTSNWVASSGNFTRCAASVITLASIT